MRSFKWILVVIIVGLAGCQTVKPYEKEYLLSPLMDDAGVAPLKSTMAGTAAASFEKLAGGSGGNSATSCPTCGG